MLSSSVTYLAAHRQSGGVCSGTLWHCTKGDVRHAVTFYAVLAAANVLHSYESEPAYAKGDTPVHTWYVVGASAWSSTSTAIQLSTSVASASSSLSSSAATAATTSSLSSSSLTKPVSTQHSSSNTNKNHCCFRLVTNQGTQIYCWTGTEWDRDVWLAALQAGLELTLSLSQLMPTRVQSGPPDPLHNNKSGGGSKQKTSSGKPAVAATATAVVRTTFFGARIALKYCQSCGVTEEQTSIGTAVHPVIQYGAEDRQDLCSACSTAQGLLQHVQFLQCLQAAVAVENQTLAQARSACWDILTPHAPPNDNVPSAAAEDVSDPKISAPTTTTTAAADAHSSNSTAESWSHVESTGNNGTEASSNEGTNSAGSGGSSNESDHKEGSWHEIHKNNVPRPAALATAWVTVPPTPASTQALTDYLSTSAQFATWARQCSVLASLQTDFLNGRLNVADFMELLDEAAGCDTMETVAATSLKKQAFRVAGDMGTAMKLLLEQALPTNENSSSSNSNTEVLQCVLEFMLDLCDDGELSSVAFFWPQLCHIHLRMLPPVNAWSAARVELMEDFLLTVATRYSIHLALELVWSHTADLEESLQVSPTALSSSLEKSSKGGGAGSSKDHVTVTETTTAVSPSCRRRRFAVLRFICELESILFDFDGGWGGGAVCLGKILSPTTHQTDLMKQSVRHIQELWVGNRNSDDVRDDGDGKAVHKQQQHRLSRSVRYDLLSRGRESKPPDEQAKEKLRIAKNADYFSCHLNFSKRLADIAEKLRFMDLENRAGFLEQELNLLNSSGTMGGDPLNRIRDHFIRVVRVPSTEGHVFRSKERTPVLLLMEIVEEMAESQPENDEGLTNITPAIDNTADIGPTSEKDDMKDQIATMKSECEIPEPPSSLPDSNNEEAHLPSELANADFVLKSSTPMTPLLEGALEGCRASPGPKALKRFDNEGETIETLTPATPKRDVELIVNSIAQEQLKEIVLPDLGLSPNIVPREVEVSGNDGSATAEVRGGTAMLRHPSFGFSGDKRESSRRPCTRTEGDDFSRSARKMSTLGSIKGTANDVGDPKNTLAPTGDIRRAVLTTIMMRGLQGNTIAAGAADSVQRSLKELERKRATELLLSDDDDAAAIEPLHESTEYEMESTRQKMVALGLSPSLEEAELASRPTEEDEVMEAIRLMLIQNQVAQGNLSRADAMKVLQHTSLSPINATNQSRSFDESVDMSDHPMIDAGDVDPRLVGCGPLPPAVLQAMTLWKGGTVTHAELLQLVKKDIEFVKHSILVDAESLDMLTENSAFWGRFAFGERWAEKKSRIGSSSPQGSTPGWDMMGVIVKSNDDLRQEAFVMQLIELCQEAFELAELELWISPYRIIATGRTTGVIECVRNAMSFDALKKRPGYGKGGLREHLQRMTEFTADPGGSFKSAQQNFVRSLAAYSLLSYLFLFKDRHNGNLLLDTAGHVIHIDFGFVFGIAPGGSFSLEMSTPFKLTEEMLDVMGGLRSPLFSEFVTLFCCGFLALQSHCDTFLTLVEITSKESTFKCFEGRDTEEIVLKLREKFCPDLSKEDTVTFALDLIKQAAISYGTRQYDLYQYISQGIVA